MDDKEKANALSREVIGAAIEVHKSLGPGLLESAYESCLCQELKLRGIPFQRQVPLGLEYKGTTLLLRHSFDDPKCGKYIEGSRNFPTGTASTYDHKLGFLLFIPQVALFSESG